MIYEYQCQECEKHFDIIKPVSEYNTLEICKLCDRPMQKVLSIKMTMVDKTRPEYYHSLGKWVKSKHHRKELMKIHNLEEVGSERCDTIHAESEKILQHKLAKKWADI